MGNKVLVFFACVVLLIGLMAASWHEALAASGESANVGAGVNVGYKFDRQTTAHRTSIAVVDTAATTMTNANLATCTEFLVGGRKNVSVSPHFSVNNATISLMYVAVWKDGDVVTGVRTLGPVTLSGPGSAIRVRNDGTNGAGGTDRYVGETYVWDSLGANVGYVVCTTAPSSGTVRLWIGSY